MAFCELCDIDSVFLRCFCIKCFINQHLTYEMWLLKIQNVSGCDLFQALVSASAILNNGFERLKRAQETMTRRPNPDFHVELMRLRQNWRLKKVGKSILGDLSYKSGLLIHHQF